jgi:tRNA (adenine22-N1)-methyltransferase
MMNSSRVGNELSQRLEVLQSFYTDQRHIWDIGCDHGLLGGSFRDKDVDTIQLVDPAKAVIDKLLKNHVASYITKAKIIITQSEGQNLKVTTQNNLIFIAGMGGKEIGEIIEKLLPQLDSTSKFVISPHRKILELRLKLSKLSIGLESELVLAEGGQFYQVMSLIPGADGKIPLYGDQMWDSEVGEQYRLHQLKHFKLHQDPQSKDYCSYLKQRSYR